MAAGKYTTFSLQKLVRFDFEFYLGFDMSIFFRQFLDNLMKCTDNFMSADAEDIVHHLMFGDLRYVEKQDS